MTDQVIIDLQASPRQISEAALESWGSEQRVFISSVMQGLELERQAVAAAVERIGAEPVMFERFGGRDDAPDKAYLSEVRSSTIYVAILGRRYGRLSASRRSATHEEYREAERTHLRVCAWVRANDEREGDQQSLVDEIRTFHVTGAFADTDGLTSDVISRLRRVAAEDLSPWCKLGRVVFRASHIRDDGKEIVIDAVVHDPAVVDAIEALRPGIFRQRDLSLTYAESSQTVVVKRVVTQTSASRARRIEVTCEAYRGSTSFPATVSIRGYSDDEITKFTLRRALFGDPMPSDVLQFGDMGKPLTPLDGRMLPDDVLRPLIHVLLTEALVGSRRARRVLPIRLAADLEGKRELVVEWVPHGSERETLQVQGTVRIG